MRVSYLAECPGLADQLVPGLLDHWRYVFPEHTAADRIAKFRAHENVDTLPIAWIAHEGDRVLGTAALRIHDLEGRDDLSPWLGGVYVRPEFRRQGIASNLCRIVEGKAHEMGFRLLYLFTDGQERLYAQLGWKHFESFMWHGHKSSIMIKVPLPPKNSLDRTRDA